MEQSLGTRKSLAGASAASALLRALAFAFVFCAALPAQAACLIGGQVRNDIPAGNQCLEAQRTGCVRSLLTPDQYTACLQANKVANDSGKTCIIGGTIHNELNAQDCEEAKATGCVQRLLTPTQYRACLAAQHH